MPLKPHVVDLVSDFKASEGAKRRDGVFYVNNNNNNKNIYIYLYY